MKGGETCLAEENGKTDILERYNSILSDYMEKFKDMKSVEIRNAILKWIGYALTKLENGKKDDIVDIALQSLATLESYITLMNYRRQQIYNRSSTSYSRNNSYNRNKSYNRRQ